MRSRFVLPVVAAVALAGCAGTTHVKTTATPSATPSQAPSPTPSPTLGPTGDPLTGLAPGKGPVVAVKVDNAFLARPYQRGLTQAAIVYQELVEGGSTRFMAVFESPSAPQEVGPVRSGRESDINILRGLGTPAIGFSGANSGVLALFRSAASSGYLVDAAYDTAPSAYRLGEFRSDARNYFVRPAALGAQRGGSQPRDIGWRFGPSTAGVPATSGVVAYSGSSTVTVRYDTASGRYVLSQDGRVLPVSPANLVVQSVSVRSSRFADVHGNNTPYTVSVGTGRVVVLRDGRKVMGAWKRDGFGATRFVDAAGADILLKPGPTWVFLLPTQGSMSFS